MSRYNDIVNALITRLGQIATASGYQTDAGLRVWKNLEYQSAPPEKPCLIVYPGDVSHSVEGDPPPSLGEESHGLPVKIEGFTADTERGDQAEALRYDIVKALRVDPYFGDLADGFDGATRTSASVEQAGDDGFLGFVEVEFTIAYTTLHGEM